jgi:quinol monooxygenase YgiN
MQLPQRTLSDERVRGKVCLSVRNLYAKSDRRSAMVLDWLDWKEAAVTNISTRGNIVTIINVFTVEPAKQEALVTLLTRATDETVRHMPGFISANIHRSVDGVRVTNYAQWRTRADLEAMLRHPAAMPHLREATELATNVDPHVYEVAAVRGGRSIPSRRALGAMATGAMAIGAYAIGALAIGRLAIGALTLRHGRIRSLLLDDVSVARLEVRELVLDRG